MENRQDLMTRRGFLGRAIGAGLGAVVLNSERAGAGIDMKNIMNSVLGYKSLNIREYNGPYENYLGFEKINNLEGVLKNNNPLVVEKCSYDNYKSEVDSESCGENEEEQWIPIVKYNEFPGPEFDSKEHFEYFKISGEEATREDLRKFYTEENGILILNGELNSSQEFGTNSRDSPQKFTVYFNPESMENKSGTLIVNMVNYNPNGENSISTSISNTSNPDTFVIKSIAYIDGEAYSLHMPIPVDGEQGIRLTKDKSGITSIELNWENQWYPVIGSNALDGISCSASIIPIFRKDWKPELTGCTIEEFKCPEPEVILPPEPDVFMGCYREL